tara:strand:+ start:9403 stop:10149 length:747 start_codon:yes stop_codon:yes gene_type:complete
MNIKATVDYYVNLLIIQYHNKPKAKAHIDAVADTLLMDGIMFDVRDGFDIDTAVGKQLDTLGKYIGLDRFFIGELFPDTYFGFADAMDIGGTSPKIVGFNDAVSPDKTGFFVDAADIVANTQALNDETYRTLLKLKIVQNHSNHSFESISASIFDFFGGDVVVKDNYDMTMTYLIGDASTTLIRVALQKEVFPRPIGVGLQAISGVKFFGFADATKTSIPSYIIGFNDSTIGLTKDGSFMNAKRDIIQ